MVPICYEEGLPGGARDGCAEFVNVAAEMYVKEVLAGLFARVRSDGKGYACTARYKRRVEREEEAWLRGEVVRNAAGLLPVEVETGLGRRPFGMEDLRLSLEMGDPFVGQVPLLAKRVAVGWRVGGLEIEENESSPERERRREEYPINGFHSNGVHHHTDEMDVDDNDWGWSGGANGDRDSLGGILDDCLAVGQ